MSLQQKLSAFKAQFQSGRPPFEAIPAAVHEAFARGTAELAASGAAGRALGAGAAAPPFDLKDAYGREVRLAELLATGPVVLTFYRGVWCPYCNIDLQELESHAERIRAAGASLLAITPQTAPNSRKLTTDHRLSFPVLHDPGNAVAQQYGLRFFLPDYLIAVFRQLGVDLSVFNGNEDRTLPMPARFIVARDGRIAYAEVSADYTERPDPAELFPTLEALRLQAAA